MWLLACLAVAHAAATVPPADGLDQSILEGISMDDECLADGVQCALDAFQLRASRLKAAASISASSAIASGTKAGRPPRRQGSPLRALGIVGMDDDLMVASKVAARQAGASLPVEAAMAVGALTSGRFAGSPTMADARGVQLRAAAVGAPPAAQTHVAQGVADANRNGSPTPGEEQTSERQGSMSSLLVALSFSVGLASALLLTCATYDGFARRRHTARFLACRTNVQRVQQVLLKGEGEVPLCPFCLDYIHNTWLKSKVVFICGHSFHLDCANKCLSSAGTCPLCAEASAGPTAGAETEDAPERTPETSKDPEDKEEEEDDSESKVGSLGGNGVAATPAASAVEVRSFMLSSLRRKHADIISQACVERWASCHIETWLSDFARPPYASVFRWHS